MKRQAVVFALCALADGFSTIAEGSTWYLFGTTDRDEPAAADIDLLVLCRDSYQADKLRRVIDVDLLGPPLDLSFMTYDEASEVAVIARQRARQIYPKTR